jgi:hypothetical protein
MGRNLSKGRSQGRNQVAESWGMDGIRKGYRVRGRGINWKQTYVPQIVSLSQ